ncbi:MAG: hypothetical protein NT023_05785 [Armatimonadetes bacterium]|nr:hypothetical protein [Armatimonadota bacterium]
MTNENKNPFLEGEAIFAYSRKEALKDGVLVDVTNIAKQAGFRYPVAVTRALWEDVKRIPSSQWSQDGEGRLWDVLWMGYIAIRRSNEASDTLRYQIVMHVGQRKFYTVKLVCGPGDEAEPVITLMRPDED